MSMLPSQLLEGTRQLSPLPLRPGQDEPFHLRERYFSRCGESRERKGENVFRHRPPLEDAVP